MVTNGDRIIVELEHKCGEGNVGDLIGELAMKEPEKATRMLSGMAKTDCIFLLLNKDIFKITLDVILLIVKEDILGIIKVNRRIKSSFCLLKHTKT